jgi:hypothetical protein
MSEPLLDKSVQDDTKLDVTFKTPVLITSIGFFCIFAAFNTTQALASSLSKSLANACFASLYGVFALVCVIAPLAVNYLGPKAAMILGGAPYCLMVLTYLKPMWATSLPAHIAVGLGAPLIWTGSAVFISRYAKYSAALSNKPIAEPTNFLNGVFFSLLHFTGTGLILASVIMSIWGSKANTFMFVILGAIGAFGLFVISLSPSPPTPEELATIQKELTQAADVEYSASKGRRSGSINDLNDDLDEAKTGQVSQPSIVDVLKLIVTNPKMTLMSALIFYNGISLAFCFSDLSGGVIGKAVGTKTLGFIMASYYLWNTFFTMVWTKILTQKNTPIILCLFVLAHATYLSLLTFLPQSVNFIDNPDTTSADKQIKLFEPIFSDYVKGLLYCFLFSIGDSILQQQCQSLLQTFFSSEPAKSDQSMSAMKLVQSAGICLMFVVGIWTSNVQVKVNVLAVGLILAAVSLAVIIYRWVPMTNGVVMDDDDDDDEATTNA